MPLYAPDTAKYDVHLKYMFILGIHDKHWHLCGGLEVKTTKHKL